MINFEIALEIIAMIISFILFKYCKYSGFTLVTFILTLTALNEALIIPLAIKYNLFERNIDYNIFSLVDMTVWFIFFLGMFQKNTEKKFVIIIAIANLSYSLVEILFIHSWRDFHSDSVRVYDISIIVFSSYYLFLILKKEYHNLWKDSLFWICVACILYHSTVFINFTSLVESESYWNSKQAYIVYNILQNIANAFYYLLLCGAFFVNYINFKNEKKA
jgi:hypothetical protein